MYGTGHPYPVSRNHTLTETFIERKGRSSEAAGSIRDSKHIEIPLEFAVLSGRPVDGIKNPVKPDFPLTNGERKVIQVNGEGFRFHLPAFMVAQLRGDLVYDFSTALIDLERLKHDRYVLLSSNQRASVREYLMFLRDLPDCDYSLTMPDQSGIERALLDYWTLDSCES